MVLLYVCCTHLVKGACKDVRTNERIYDLHRSYPVGTRNGVKNGRLTERERETERETETERERRERQRERREREKREKER